MVLEYNFDEISKMIQNLELVQNIARPEMMKVAGRDINFAIPVDEVSRLLIAEIPNFYKYVKIAAHMNKVSEFSREEIAGDITDYLNWLNSKISTLLNESELKKLLED